MFDQFVSKADQLIANGDVFAVAMVVRHLPPISGKPGDKAIIFPDGSMWGWIGGGCTQSAVIKEALKSITDGQSRLIRISPLASTEEGIVEYALTCQSGGTLDIYIEPVRPRPHLVILGRSAAGKVLAKLANTVGYRVSVAAPQARREDFPEANQVHAEFDLQAVKVSVQTFVVVCTQGEGDEEALEQALKSTALYVAFVASRNKAGKVLESLSGREITPERLKQVKAPAGMGVWADTPEEIAVSILAEIVELNRRTIERKNAVAVLDAPQDAIDPICGMTVEVRKAKHVSEFEGRSFYFCCAGCKRTFDQQPDKYLLAGLTG